MSRSKSPAIPAATDPLALLRHVAGDEMFAQALTLAGDHLRLTPEKLALLIVRILNPNHVLGETDEAQLRGMSPTTLRKLKSERSIKQVLG